MASSFASDAATTHAHVASGLGPLNASFASSA
jgi:hypothetical protein